MALFRVEFIKEIINKCGVLQRDNDSGIVDALDIIPDNAQGLAFLNAEILFAHHFPPGITQPVVHHVLKSSIHYSPIQRYDLNAEYVPNCAFLGLQRLRLPQQAQELVLGAGYSLDTHIKVMVGKSAVLFVLEEQLPSQISERYRRLDQIVKISNPFPFRNISFFKARPVFSSVPAELNYSVSIWSEFTLWFWGLLFFGDIPSVIGLKGMDERIRPVVHHELEQMECKFHLTVVFADIMFFTICCSIHLLPVSMEDKERQIPQMPHPLAVLLVQQRLGIIALGIRPRPARREISRVCRIEEYVRYAALVRERAGHGLPPLACLPLSFAGSSSFQSKLKRSCGWCFPLWTAWASRA